VRLLCFLARRFAWQPHAQALPTAPFGQPPGECADCVVVFVHGEPADEPPERWKSTQDHARKHVEWMARKRDLKRVVLHSFAHLAEESASPEFTDRWIQVLAERLRGRGYEVATTAFGWTNAWQMDVHGEPMAKVGKVL
jgi:hypothetical protein